MGGRMKDRRGRWSEAMACARVGDTECVCVLNECAETRLRDVEEMVVMVVKMIEDSRPGVP